MLPPTKVRKLLLRMFHDEVGHWNFTATKQFIKDRFWLPCIVSEISDYVKGCEECQEMKLLAPYHSGQRFPLTGLFHLFPLDFAGPFPVTRAGNKFMHIGVEHLTGCPIAVAAPSSSATVVLNFVRTQILDPFGFRRVMMTENATSFKAKAVQEFAKEKGFELKPTLSCARMSNKCVERMVGTVKHSIAKIVAEINKEWDQTITNVIHGYCRRQITNHYFPFELR